MDINTDASRAIYEARFIFIIFLTQEAAVRYNTEQRLFRYIVMGGAGVLLLGAKFQGELVAIQFFFPRGHD
jgi:hypothetical protein